MCLRRMGILHCAGYAHPEPGLADTLDFFFRKHAPGNKFFIKSKFLAVQGADQEPLDRHNTGLVKDYTTQTLQRSKEGVQLE